MKLDLSLNNSALYAGCDIEEVAGKLNLKTLPAEAVQIVGRNVNQWVQSLPVGSRDEVVLSGPMAIWSYLVVFHAVVHAFREVKYDDGRGNVVVVARHG